MQVTFFSVNVLGRLPTGGLLSARHLCCSFPGWQDLSCKASRTCWTSNRKILAVGRKQGMRPRFAHERTVAAVTPRTAPSSAGPTRRLVLSVFMKSESMPSPISGQRSGFAWTWLSALSLEISRAWRRSAWYLALSRRGVGAALHSSPAISSKAFSADISWLDRSSTGPLPLAIRASLRVRSSARW
jgi:hypothetical protein